MASTPSKSPSFLERNEFLIRRLHSLAGLVPVGAYMVVHLLTNATVLDSPATYQRAVYQIHSLGMLLPVVEWAFIFLPILFHGILGVVIIFGGLPNNGTYRTASNFRYTMQRVTGMIAMVFIFWHIFHMHGWFHTDWWMTNVARPGGGGQFNPLAATSSLGRAMQGFFYPAFYAIGIGACVYHLANGIWTMGITWGVWITPRAQARASWVCLVVGLGLLGVGGAAWVGAIRSSGTEAIEKAEGIERKMYNARIESGELQEDEKHAAPKQSASLEPTSPDGPSSTADDTAQAP